MRLIAIVLFTILIRESKQACEIQARSPPVFSGGYMTAWNVFDTSAQPDWSITTHSDGKIEFNSDMFQLSSGDRPFIDLFYSFFEFVSSSDSATCTIPWNSCTTYEYIHTGPSCGNDSKVPDELLRGLNAFDGGHARQKYRSIK